MNSVTPRLKHTVDFKVPVLADLKLDRCLTVNERTERKTAFKVFTVGWWRKCPSAGA